MKRKTIFFGGGPYVIPIIQELAEKFDLRLVLTTEREPNEPTTWFCKQNKIPLLKVRAFDEKFLGKIREINSEVAVLAYFGRIVPKKVLDMFSKGIINTHPSLLPKYRGPTPGQTALLNGDKFSGVTIMKLDALVDHGPLLAFAQEPIFENDTSDSLHKRLFSIGAELLMKSLNDYLNGNLKLIEQNHKAATFTERLNRQSGFIDFNNPPSLTELDRKIRAFYPYPTVWTKAKLYGVEKSIKLLPEGKVQVEGRNVMQQKDFINGYPEGKEILSKLKLFSK